MPYYTILAFIEYGKLFRWNMEIFVVIGALIFIFGAICFFLEAFDKSLWWGLGCLLFSPVSLVFLFKYWNDVKNAFFMELLGISIMAMAFLLGG